VTYDESSRCYLTCFLFNNEEGVTIVVPDESDLAPVFREGLETIEYDMSLPVHGDARGAILVCYGESGSFFRVFSVGLEGRVFEDGLEGLVVAAALS
jgi:hypothetical protein